MVKNRLLANGSDFKWDLKSKPMAAILSETIQNLGKKLHDFEKSSFQFVLT